MVEKYLFLYHLGGAVSIEQLYRPLRLLLRRRRVIEFEMGHRLIGGARNLTEDEFKPLGQLRGLARQLQRSLQTLPVAHFSQNDRQVVLAERDQIPRLNLFGQ